MFCSKKSFKLILLLAFFTIANFLTACQKSSDPSPAPVTLNPAGGPPQHPAEDAQGFINGSEWTFKTGRAFLRNSHGVPFLDISLWNEVVSDPCNVEIKPRLEVHVYTYDKVQELSLEGRDPFAKLPQLIFSDATKASLHLSDALTAIIADKGSIGIDAVSDVIVSGFVHGSFPASDSIGRTEVNGGFQVGLCPQPQP